MSSQTLIREVQAALGIEVDGRAGPQTWTAIHNRIVKPKPRNDIDSAFAEAVDARSERVIAKLLPEVAPYARALVQRAAAVGITIKLISGLRSYEEQAALYAQGRTAPGNKVTNARAGHSNHNFGIAFDVGVFEGSRYLGDSPKYRAVGVLGVELGLEWGGNWRSFTDLPHYQLRPSWAIGMTESKMLAALRQRASIGTPVYA